ncbi:hypothetical protein H2204_010277 [Knufia peltigerae]|uniref:Cyclohexanone monooxygenase n=1 Tax=Knufia peltigerae TaxID=1002370 RepID=A0AA39CSY4_9EURO|nr:hypothetical protein H2204_010277 [Knufia peltigerae]
MVAVTQNGICPPGEVDVVIVGAGFGGIYLLHKLRKIGYSVQAFESAGGLGGVWRRNAYPGARVDTNVPYYEFAVDEIWKDWYWKETYPGRDELCDYFDYIDTKWDLSKDIKFNTTVVSAHFDPDQNKWTVRTDAGDCIKTRFFLPCTGVASKIYVPHMKGLETFRGPSFHTARWPEAGVDIEGKRVGVIGTGASGVQVIQEMGPYVKQLTVFQRTANMALPMGQQKLSKADQDREKPNYPQQHAFVKKSKKGFPIVGRDKKTAEDSPQERKEFWETLWQKQGFHPWTGNYKDLVYDQDANDEFYLFWRDKVTQRITRTNDPDLIENLAPRKPPHPFGVKRTSLEQNYYEIYNQDNVELVNIKKNPIIEITPTGVTTAEKTYELDVLVLATGFDAVTGGLCLMDIRGIDNASLKDKWEKGTSTYLGIATSGFPNMLMMYGPHSPGAFAVGPTLNEVQGDWIISCMQHMDRKNFARVDVSRAAETHWSKHVNTLVNSSLFPKANGWWVGGNIPGKPREALSYIGGLEQYRKTIDQCCENGYEGFVFT